MKFVNNPVIDVFIRPPSEVTPRLCPRMVLKTMRFL